MAKRGFTLVELLVVIMIIGILMGIVIPAIMGGLGEGAEVNCNSNLKSLRRDGGVNIIQGAEWDTVFGKCV